MMLWRMSTPPRAVANKLIKALCLSCGDQRKTFSLPLFDIKQNQIWDTNACRNRHLRTASHSRTLTWGLSRSCQERPLVLRSNWNWHIHCGQKHAEILPMLESRIQNDADNSQGVTSTSSQFFKRQRMAMAMAELDNERCLETGFRISSGPNHLCYVPSCDLLGLAVSYWYIWIYLICFLFHICSMFH